MRRMKISVLFVACLAMFVSRTSAQRSVGKSSPTYGSTNARAKQFLQHPRVFLDVSPIAIKKVLDAMYCALQCLRDARCLSYNFKVKRNEEGTFDCRLLATDKYNSSDYLKSSTDFSHHSLKTPCDGSPCQNGATCWPVYETQDFKCECAPRYCGKTCTTLVSSCEDIARSGTRNDGAYELFVHGTILEAYCDFTSNNRGWTLVARFSNSDAKSWMDDSGDYWYDRTSPIGRTTDPADNTDMISPAFWLVTGTEFKMTRSDDSSHTALLSTTGGCLGGQTFRSKMTSYGDFRNSTVWAKNKCHGRCDVRYGGQYNVTAGFAAAECDEKLQNRNQIGFWCDWSNNGAVMTIGGAGGKNGTSPCFRAAHGIGITEADAASFAHDQHKKVYPSEGEFDFGNRAVTSKFKIPPYSLDLWVR